MSPPDAPHDPSGAGSEKTPLHDEHVRAGAHMVDFHGWRMPLRYGTIPEEHQKVRNCAGLFDLCHMGRLEVVGPDAAAWVGKVITNDYDAMRDGSARYTLIVNERGGIIDDALVYRLPQSIFLVVNASNRARVIAWMEDARGSLDARLHDRTHELAMVAIQGPQAVRILPAAVERFDASWETMKYYSIAAAHIGGQVARIARTGYTGEDGFEVYLDAADAPGLWGRLLEIGGNRLSPVGLGARDTLRLEAAMPLYGNELDEETDPFEAGLDFAVKLEKARPFIGRESLLEKRETVPSRRLTGFRLLGKRVARSGMTIHAATEKGGEEPVGRITSGAPSPTLGVPIALGYLKASVGEKARASLTVDVRGNREPAQIEALPFFSRTRKKDK